MSPEEIVRDLNTSIIRWYPFRDDADFIYIGSEDAIFSFMQEKYGERVTLFSYDEEDGECAPKAVSANLSAHAADELRADYIISIAYPELFRDPSGIFTWAKAHLKSDGRLILGMNNRFGIKYFCGDRDLYTNNNFDGIDDYFRAYRSPDDKFLGRTYDRQRLQDMLQSSGFADNKFYSVFSDLENASFIFADGYIPNEELSIRIFPTYNSPDTLFLEEERLYTSLLKNGMFHKMANAYLIECSLDGTHTDALQVTSSMDRGHADAMITIIHDNDTVSKKAPFPEGEKSLENLAENMEKLKSRGIPVVEGDLENGVYTMPLIHAETGLMYLRRIFREDKNLFLKRLDEFRDEIVKSSDSFEGVYEPPVPEHETDEQRNKRLKKKKELWEQETMLLQKEGFPDLIPLNSFFIDGKFVFYDQEFCIPNYPLKAILYRMVSVIQTGDPAEEEIIRTKDLFSRYGMDMDDRDRFYYLSYIAGDWLRRLRKEEELRHYHEKKRRDANLINANRQRMNFSVDDYQKLFVDVLDMADTRKLIIFGTGVFARRFLDLYGQDYEIYAAIDNNQSKWGQHLDPGGVEIRSPEILRDLRHGEYKIIICIKSYFSVMRQLDAMGITEYSIYDPAKAYARKRHPLTPESIENYNNSTVATGGKKYHVGYIAGVFDLYHIGHLNMFRRAKEMCDYLIVGVVSDEGVLHKKRTEPFVPFDERIEMVKSCRYVDEAVEIPYLYNGTEDAWKMHHFDVQFSGSDYVNDPGFEDYKKFLESHGATLEFFPYTQSTSSTKLKGLIDKKLI